MNILNRLLRYYAFFRRGYSLYVSFPLGYIQFIIVVYSLALTNIPFLKEWFPHLTYFAIFTIILVGVISTLSGWWDFKHGSVITDNVLQTRSNPATWDTIDASILNSEALLDLFNGRKEEGEEKIRKAIELYKKWKR